MASATGQALSWNAVAFTCTILLYILQQVGLLYHIGKFSLALLFLAFFDFLVLVYFLTNHSSDNAALKGGTCWVIYVWSLTIKILMFFFVILSEGTPTPGVIISGPRGAASEVSLLIAICLAVYSLLSFRASEQLLGGTNVISTESMLHADAITHVILDLFDVVAAFHTFTSVPDAIIRQTGWLRLIAGIFVSLAVFLHAYSFPSVGTKLSSKLVVKDPGDMLMVRKHAALVGICFVDLPLAFLRVFTWSLFPTYEGFSPLLFKNICFIPIQYERIRHCSLAMQLKGERERKIRAQNALAAADADGLSEGTRRLMTVNRWAAQKQAQYSTANMSSRSQSNLRMLSSINSGNLDDEPPRRRLLGSSIVRWMRRRNKKDAADGTLATQAQVKADAEESSPAYGSSPERLLEICQSVRLDRTIPVTGFRMKRVLQKLLFMYKVGGRQGLAILLDDVLRVAFWRQFRLAFPFMTMWISQIAIVSCLFFFYNSSTALFPIQMFDISFISEVGWVWSDIPVDIKVALIVICGHSLLVFILFFLAAPILDVLFLTLYVTIKLSSFFVTVLTFRDFGILDNLFFLKSSGTLTDVGRYAIFVFVVEPICGVLMSLYPFLCAMLGREYLTYVIPPPKTGAFKRVQRAVFNQEHTSSNSMDLDYANIDAETREDENGVVTTISLMVFINCRYMTCPISMHELLMGPNLIKGLRLTDGLLRVHWRQLVVAFIIRLWASYLYVDFPRSVMSVEENATRISGIDEIFKSKGVKWYARFNLCTILFAAHLLLMIVYTIFSQIVRLVAMRRFEHKALLVDLTAAWNRQHEEIIHGFTSPGPDYPGKKQKDSFMDMLQLIEKYQMQGFFTSPGDMVPGFF